MVLLDNRITSESKKLAFLKKKKTTKKKVQKYFAKIIQPGNNHCQIVPQNWAAYSHL